MKSAKKSPQRAFPGAVRLCKMPSKNTQIPKRRSTPHKRGAHVGMAGVSGKSWSLAVGKCKTIHVGDIFLVKCIAPHKCIRVGAARKQ